MSFPLFYTGTTSGMIAVGGECLARKKQRDVFTPLAWKDYIVFLNLVPERVGEASPFRKAMQTYRGRPANYEGLGFIQGINI